MNTLFLEGQLGSSSDMLSDYIDCALILAEQNDLGPKEYTQILYLTSRCCQMVNEREIPVVYSFIERFDQKLRVNDNFLGSMTTIDIATTFSSISKIRKIIKKKSDPSMTALESIHHRLLNRVPAQLPRFEDRHLVQIIHTIGTFHEKVPWNICIQVLDEMSTKRDLSSFTPQGVVMLADSLSRLASSVHKADAMVGVNVSFRSIWMDIMRCFTRFDYKELQRNWPSVILTSYVSSRIRGLEGEGKFVNFLVKAVMHQREIGIIDNDRIEELRDSIIRLGYDVSSLEGCNFIPR